ncbi:hypothetical protein P7K49_018476, partial [Saguinus oedipus]
TQWKWTVNKAPQREAQAQGVAARPGHGRPSPWEAITMGYSGSGTDSQQGEEVLGPEFLPLRHRQHLAPASIPAGVMTWRHVNQAVNVE